MSNLFINGSPNKNGNTAALAKALFKGKEYETINLTDYVIGSYGQELPGDQLAGKKMYFLFQGAAPEKWMLEAGEYTMKRFARLYGMEYDGMATNKKEAETLAETL